MVCALRDSIVDMAMLMLGMANPQMIGDAIRSEFPDLDMSVQRFAGMRDPAGKYESRRPYVKIVVARRGQTDSMELRIPENVLLAVPDWREFVLFEVRLAVEELPPAPLAS